MRHSKTPGLSVPVWAVAALAAAIVAAVAFAAAAENTAAVLPPALEKLVQRFVADNSGVIVTRQTTVYEQHAPGNNERDEQELSILQQDRKGIAVRLHRVVEKGRTLSADEVAKLQEERDKRYASETPRITTRYSFPYYPESSGDYAYAAPKPCAECPGGMSMNFTSPMQDEKHGRGTLMFDAATSRIEKLDFVPNALPKHATSAKVIYTFGRHDDGGWGVTRVEEHYSGRMLLISGTADRTTTVTHVKHYPTLDEGRRALAGSS